jgi:hypothetical protein
MTMALLAASQPGRAQNQQPPLAVRSAAAAAQQINVALELLVQELEKQRLRIVELEKQCGEPCAAGAGK